MRLVCPNCVAQYEVADGTIPAAGRDVQCANCNHIWFQDSAFRLSVDDIAFVPEPGEGPLFDTDEAQDTAATVSGPTVGASTVFRSKRAAQYALSRGDTDAETDPETDAGGAETDDDAPPRPMPRINAEVMDILRSEAAFSTRLKSEGKPDQTPAATQAAEPVSGDAPSHGIAAAPEPLSVPGHPAAPNWAEAAAVRRWQNPLTDPAPAEPPAPDSRSEQLDPPDAQVAVPAGPRPTRIMGGARSAVGDLAAIADDDAQIADPADIGSDADDDANQPGQDDAVGAELAADKPATRPGFERLRIRGLTVEAVDSAAVDKAAEQAAISPARPAKPPFSFPKEPEQPLPAARTAPVADGAQARGMPAGVRRVLLPDVEELNTSLRMETRANDADLRSTAFEGDDEAIRGGNFGLGLVTALMLFGVFWALYLLGPAISDTVPAADAYVAAFRNFIDTALDTTAQALVPLIGWLESL